MSLFEQLERQCEQTTWLTPLILQLNEQIIALETSSQDLRQTLERYFECVLCDPIHTPDVIVQAIEAPAYDETQLTWQDWPRPASKSGRKDAIFDDTPEGRLVYKVKTGMLFWQKSTLPLAIGPVRAHPNQVINFILTQNLNHHLRHNWLLGHAAGLQIQGQGLAIAGLSGGGKSTLMLHLLAQGEHFISNDRLLLKQQGQQVLMRGIPKQPRINPGTIVHNPRLQGLISETARQDYLAMPEHELRQLEYKFDADVNQLYHPNCYLAESPLKALIVLNWQVDSPEATQLVCTNFNEAPHLLPALIKSAGPFYADTNGQFLSRGQAIEENLASQPYLKELGQVVCWELKGKIDFDQAQKLILKQLKAVC